MTILHGCGCFEDTEMGVLWPCTLHRGMETDAERDEREQQEIVEEAARMNGWT